ncbi:hypothetical protein K470DRAFT_260661 [Piedraia hortae CBS 480.64]|uniref:Uncharacterized protein n=1 Tax=Piedraia hortae CBS 480.64 TaxID=1314780 RepID=A0A6A7BR61_9PEZI|nr:hypothetical protein K470DRAFT_260661 [Piedraia hortae CBS 480.64]
MSSYFGPLRTTIHERPNWYKSHLGLKLHSRRCMKSLSKEGCTKSEVEYLWCAANCVIDPRRVWKSASIICASAHIVTCHANSEVETVMMPDKESYPLRSLKDDLFPLSSTPLTNSLSPHQNPCLPPPIQPSPASSQKGTYAIHTNLIPPSLPGAGE